MRSTDISTCVVYVVHVTSAAMVLCTFLCIENEKLYVMFMREMSQCFVSNTRLNQIELVIFQQKLQEAQSNLGQKYAVVFHAQQFVQ